MLLNLFNEMRGQGAGVGARAARPDQRLKQRVTFADMDEFYYLPGRSW
jgi:uncharacterized protein with von Willebrand factor type A (vWA) domain